VKKHSKIEENEKVNKRVKEGVEKEKTYIQRRELRKIQKKN
jgi:hypothetical protein